MLGSPPSVASRRRAASRQPGATSTRQGAGEHRRRHGEADRIARGPSRAEGPTVDRSGTVYRTKSCQPRFRVSWGGRHLRGPAARRCLRLTQLDGLRALLLAGVMTNHIVWVAPYWLGALIPGAWVCLDVFFILSGFFIGTLLLNEIDKTGAIRYRPFVVSRLFRIYPAMFLTIMVSTAFLVRDHFDATESRQARAHQPRVRVQLAVRLRLGVAAGLQHPLHARHRVPVLPAAPAADDRPPQAAGIAVGLADHRAGDHRRIGAHPSPHVARAADVPRSVLRAPTPASTTSSSGCSLPCSCTGGGSVAACRPC